MAPVPLATLPDDVATQVGDAGAKQVNLYRCLAHAPDLLRAWIAFAWALRGNSATSRRMRELMILRTAMLHESHYEWHQHIHMATELGVSEAEVAELESWETSSRSRSRGPAPGHPRPIRCTRAISRRPLSNWYPARPSAASACPRSRP